MSYSTSCAELQQVTQAPVLNNLAITFHNPQACAVIPSNCFQIASRPVSFHKLKNSACMEGVVMLHARVLRLRTSAAAHRA